MKIKVIFLPYRAHKFSENLEVVDENFAKAPPLGEAYITAALENAGFDVELIDAHIFKWDVQRILEEIRARGGADYLLFRISTYTFFDNLLQIEFLKKHLNATTIVGGPNMFIYPRETMRYEAFDYGFYGEAIETLPEFFELIRLGKDPHQVRGLVYRKNGAVVVNPAPPFVPFSRYPLPARHHLPNHLYYSQVSQWRNFTIMMTMLSCPHNCSFCPMGYGPWKKRVTFRTEKQVVDEMQLCYENYGVREIDIFDADFFTNRARVIRIAEEIKRRGLNIKWSCRARLDSVDEESLAAAADAGCVRIMYGIESANQEILDELKKGESVSATKRVLELTRNMGIRPLGFFMLGNPGETVEQIKRTIRFAKALPLDYAQFMRTIAKPGTEIHHQKIKSSGKDVWQLYLLGTISDEKQVGYDLTTLPRAEIEKWIYKAYLSFYFRPKIIWKMLLHIRSFSEIVRYIKTSWLMLKKALQKIFRI